jgi:hypothetical protein
MCSSPNHPGIRPTFPLVRSIGCASPLLPHKQRYTPSKVSQTSGTGCSSPIALHKNLNNSPSMPRLQLLDCPPSPLSEARTSTPEIGENVPPITDTLCLGPVHQNNFLMMVQSNDLPRAHSSTDVGVVVPQRTNENPESMEEDWFTSMTQSITENKAFFTSPPKIRPNILDDI